MGVTNSTHYLLSYDDFKSKHISSCMVHNGDWLDIRPLFNIYRLSTSNIDVSSLFQESDIYIGFYSESSEELLNYIKILNPVWIIYNDENSRDITTYNLPLLDSSDVIQKSYMDILGVNVSKCPWSSLSSKVVNNNIDYLSWIRYMVAIVHNKMDKRQVDKVCPYFSLYYNKIVMRSNRLKPLLYYWFTYLNFNACESATYMASSYILNILGGGDVGEFYRNVTTRPVEVDS